MADSRHSNNLHPGNKRTKKHIIHGAAASLLVCIAIAGLFTINVEPIKAFGGAVWLKNGPHYLSDTQIKSRIVQLNAPKEAALVTEISKSTPSCDSLDEGYCQQTPGVFVYKTLVTAAVPYKPGTPDRKEVIGYCTLCNDGTWSPSCAVGRGACSWHSGVQAYNVAEYRTIPGTLAVQAQPAVYNYASMTYKDSTLYSAPDTPTMRTIVGF